MVKNITNSQWHLVVESSVAAVEDTIENRGLYRVFVSRLFWRGFGDYNTTIARLSPPSGLERGGWELLHVCGCEMGRDRAFPIVLPIAVGVLKRSRGWSRDSSIQSVDRATKNKLSLFNDEKWQNTRMRLAWSYSCAPLIEDWGCGTRELRERERVANRRWFIGTAWKVNLRRLGE